MGRLGEAKANRVWFYVWSAYLGVICVTSLILVIPPGLLSLVSFGLLSGWYFSVGQAQATYVKETLRDGYERKPWKKPLLIALCCWIIFLIVFTATITLATRLQ